MERSRLEQDIAAILCFVAVTVAHASCNPTATTSTTCTPANCYSADICANLTQITHIAASLEQALGTEFRYYKASSPYACNVNLFQWIRYRKELNVILNEAEPGNNGGPSCKLKLSSEASICTSILNLFKCTAFHIRLAYSNQKTCVTHEKHQAWANVVESTEKFMELVEPASNSDLDLDQRGSKLKDITTTTKSLKEILDYLVLVSNDTIGEPAEV